jgi:hypothetical protein
MKHFRDGDQITRWARGVSNALSSVEMRSWTPPQHNDPEGVAP